MTPRFRLLVLLLVVFLAGCSLFPAEEDETKGWSASKLYNAAQDAMQGGDFETAIRYYESLEAQYPFGPYAMQAQLNLAYAFYQFDEPESALAAADRFLKLHPQHPAAAYAWYLRGIVNFNRTEGLFERFLPTDPSQRDPGAARDAFQDFKQVVERFPDSEYAKDARARMLFLRNNLARHELHVALYYMDRGAYLAAANRAMYVVENYQRSPVMREALLTMIAAYKKLGLDDLAADTEKVLAYNEQQGVFMQDTKDEDASWARQLWDYFELDKN